MNHIDVLDFNVVNATSCSLDLLGQHVTMHLFMPRSTYAQSKYYLNL